MKKTKKPLKILTDDQGHRYQLVRDEEKISEGIYRIALWKRLTPPDRDHWYRLTLSSALLGGTPVFAPMEKGGE